MFACAYRFLKWLTLSNILFYQTCVHTPLVLQYQEVMRIYMCMCRQVSEMSEMLETVQKRNVQSSIMRTYLTPFGPQAPVVDIDMALVHTICANGKQHRIGNEYTYSRTYI